MFIVSVFMFVFFCFVFRLPIIDNDLLCLCPQVDRLTASECLIELGYIVAGDVLLATRHEMSLHHTRECIDKYIKRLSILVIVSFFVWLHRFLECMDDLGRLARIAEDE